MKTSDWIKIAINLLIGFLALILQKFIPIGGGGVSLIFVLTVPTTILLSIISSFIYYWLAKREKNFSKNVLVLVVISINLFITFAMYPYAD